MIPAMRLPRFHVRVEMFRTLLLCLLIATLSAACNKSKTPVTDGKTATSPDTNGGTKGPEQVVMELERKTWELAKTKDKTAAASLMADDFVDVGEGGIVNRSKVLDAFGQATISSYSIDQMQAVALAPTVVAVTYKATAQGSAQGRPLPSPVYISSVWVSNSGHWLNVLYHDTTAARQGIQ
jgi:hypothetical protein